MVNSSLIWHVFGNNSELSKIVQRVIMSRCLSNIFCTQRGWAKSCCKSINSHVCWSYHLYGNIKTTPYFMSVQLMRSGSLLPDEITSAWSNETNEYINFSYWCGHRTDKNVHKNCHRTRKYCRQSLGQLLFPVSLLFFLFY